MKKKTAFFTILCAVLAVSAFADSRSFQASVSAMVLRSQAARKSCAAYRSELSKLEQPGKPVFGSKRAALSAMRRLARDPGISPAAGKAYALAMGKLPAGIDWSWFMRSYGSIQGACAILESYDGMSRLINSTRILRFSPAERGQIRSTALAFISRNLSQSAPLNVSLVQDSLIQNLIGARLIGFDAKSLAELKALSRYGDELQSRVVARVRSRKKPTDEERASDLIFELKGADQLRTRLLPLLARASRPVIHPGLRTGGRARR